MRELPGDVFVAGQLLPEQIAMLAGQGVMTFINNRPEGEAPGQPPAPLLREHAEAAGAVFIDIPMAGQLTPDILARTDEAFREAPRPIVAFCASGTRSAVLWAFAHARALGTEPVLDALAAIGIDMPQLRPQLDAWVARTS